MKMLIVAVTLGSVVAYAAPKNAKKKHALAPSHGGVVVGLCDGRTSVEVAGLKPGEAMTRDRAQQVSDQLMADWRKKNPGAHWDDAVADNAKPGTATQVPATAPASAQGGTYGNYDARDELVWARETQKFIDEGNGIFHDAKKLGGTIGVSCDMCHPNAANTHPETYPKYQVQLQRVTLLRDMINWCIENPVKGKPLRDDDPRLRALEGYILAQRKGAKLDYGKH